MPSSFISNQRRIFEIAAVILTGAGKFIFMDRLNLRLPFIACAVLGWLIYGILREKSVKGILYYWGFRKDNFKEVCLLVLPFGLVSVVIFFIVGFARDTVNITWHIIPILVLYPLWGIVQQFLVIGLVAGNLKDMTNIKMHNWIIIGLTAILFGLLHYPFLWLVAGTFLLALFYGAIYLRSKNIYVLGIFHGWLGGLFFYTVVNRDPFLEVFQRFIK